MEERKQASGVMYHQEQGALSFTNRLALHGPESPQDTRQRKSSSRCRPAAISKIALCISVILFVAVIALTVLFLWHTGKFSSEKSSAHFGYPEVANLSLKAADDHYITLAWDPPPGKFDFYWLEVTPGGVQENGSFQKHYAGTCGNGTIIRAEQTQVTCGPFDACSSVSVTVRTYSNGPHEHISAGATLHDILISGQDLNPPRNITMLPESSSRTRLLWERPQSVSGSVKSYAVTICRTSGSCEQNPKNCTEHVTSDTWVAFESTVDTRYCVAVVTKTRCGVDEVSSRPVTAEIRTPFFGLPDVSNLSLVSRANNSVTISWERPEARFDYYMVYLTEDLGEEHGKIANDVQGSCGNGRIIHPEQTSLTCTNLKSCTNVSITLHTYRSGPPALTSVGVAIQGIFISGKDLNPPTNITMLPESSSRTRLLWERPQNVSGSVNSYVVTICRTLWSCDQNPENCTEHETSVAWMVFESTVDTQYCVAVVTKTRCGVDEVSSRPATVEIRTPMFGLPDVANLSLVSSANNSVTVSWERPEARFDYYRIYLSEDLGEEHGKVANDVQGSCGNGTIIHPEQTSLTCTNLKSCTKVSITLQTYRSGPPALTSVGVAIQGIFIAGKDPDTPRSITMVEKPPSLVRLQWEPSASMDRFLQHDVKICSAFKTCSAEEHMSGCTEHKTSKAWMDYQGSMATKYCVLVTTKAMCGEQVLESRPAVAEIRVPVFVAPEVTNLRLVSVGPHFLTAAWERPKLTFDYYWIEVITGSSDKQRVVGSCANGTIIHPDQTQVTCVQLELCSKVHFTVRTHINGPPARTSSGATLKDILIPDSVPTEVTNLKLGAVEADTFVLTWERPKACFDYYTVEVVDETSRGRSSVKCNKGVPINPSQTSVTCDQIESCANVTIRVRTHTTGPPERYSTGAVLKHVLLQGKAPREVTEVKLVTVEKDTFTVALREPDECMDYFRVDLHAAGDRLQKISYKSSTHKNLGYSKWNVTFTGVEACGELELEIAAERKGPPERESPRVKIRGINIREKCSR